MKIALIGYGKMGKAIEAIAMQRGHQVILRIGSENKALLTKDSLAAADVAIEFTGPEGAYHHIMFCLQSKIPVVSGSTGWLDKYAEVATFCRQVEGSMLYASNFSLGVNLFFALNKYLAKLMAPYSEYKVKLSETHHTAKLDAPSGTAITLAQDIIALHAAYHQWSSDPTVATEGILPIESRRQDPAPGTHVVRYHSEIDSLTIEHEAHSRQGFAMGAVLAAEFLRDKKGIFSMADVLGLAE